MKCNHCGVEVRLRSEFCANCGERVVLTMDDIIATAHDDAARRNGDALIDKLRTGIVFMLVLGSVAIGFILLYDTKLRFDGSTLPGIPANAPIAGGALSETLEKPFADPRPLPTLPATSLRVLGHRRGNTRLLLRGANGGASTQFDNAIRNGLGFLKSKQELDGGWPVTLIPANTAMDGTGDFKWGRVGVSSLALLAFLGDGHTWLFEDAASRSPFSDTVRRAVPFLLASQDPATGRFGGASGHFMYNHAMATLAMSELAALTGNADFRARAAKATDYIVKTQTKRGGWDYYGHTDSEIDDISVSAWAVQALYAARDAGITVPNETFERALRFYTLLTKGERGIYNFQQDDGQFVPARSGMVLMMRELLGDGPANQDIKELTSKLTPSIPVVKPDWARNWTPKAKTMADRTKFDPYMLYYCSYGMFFFGGHEFEEWNAKASKALFEMQDIDGAWRANDTYSLQGGTCYATALCVLSLQVHHRIVHSTAVKAAPRGLGE